jgi:MSHA pilin protein MshC
MNRPYRYNLGFTIIELVMVLVIVGVMAVVAGPKFFSTIDYDRRVYYDEVLNSIRYARKLAVATNGHIQVDLTSTNITLRKRSEGSNCTTGTTFDEIVDPANRASGYVKTAPGSITLIFSANWPIYFNGLGQALRVSDCTVLPNGANGTVMVVGGDTVTVTGETGFVQ